MNVSKDKGRNRNATRHYTLSPSALLEKDSLNTHSLSQPSRKKNRGLTVTSNLPPVVNSKYSKVWKRARTKLRAFVILKLLGEHLKLYGTSNAKLILSYKSQESNDRFLYRRASKILESESENTTIDLFPKYMLKPNGRFKNIWNFIVVLILLYTAIATPFILSFGDTIDSLGIFWTDNAINGLFFLDFVVNFFSAYNDNQGNLITDRKQIFLKYAKGWMVIDLITWFPFDLIQQTGTTSGGKTFARFLRLPKLYRLLRFSKLLKLMKSHTQNEILDKIQELLSVKNFVMKVAKSYLTVLIIIHVVSCIWYLTAKLDDFSPDTWVVRLGYQDSDIGSLYLTSMYWAFTTLITVGYGDIYAYTPMEKSLCFFWMCFGLYFSSFNISSLTSMLSSLDLKENAVENKLIIIDELCHDINLDKTLRSKLRTSIKYAADKSGFSWKEKMSILDELPKLLRYEVAINMHNGAAKFIKFFMSRDQTLVALLMPMLEPMYIESKTYLYKINDAAEEIFFLTKGRAILLYHSDIVLKNLNKGCCFGEIEIVYSERRQYDCFSQSFCEILVMHSNVIRTIQQEYPYLWQYIEDLALKRVKKFEHKIVSVEEMEKFINGKLKFEDYDKEFKLHVEKIIAKKVVRVPEDFSQVGIKDLIKKLDKLIKVAEKKPRLKKKIQNLKEEAENVCG
ncbi:hypothetical protein SteCoe_38634 [Stentor coeruleus]|uniref:Cyclic nucleotide-binding domain-containing protein n=1 Tax=Stentor coeruleus TaxID=5963 RepID=A0A1R2AL77_9CILI|nr:hypothetical protein SteCoe_38634 [Stentor coeruleus]